MQTRNGGGRPSGGGPGGRRFFSRKKFCQFCKDRVKLVDYKSGKLLERFTMETGKILPARVTGTCPYHQKQLSKAIKQARHMGMLKYIEPKRG